MNNRVYTHENYVSLRHIFDGMILYVFIIFFVAHVIFRSVDLTTLINEVESSIFTYPDRRSVSSEIDMQILKKKKKEVLKRFKYKSYETLLY